MKQIINDTVKIFNFLMVQLGKQLFFAVVYISLGIGFVGITTYQSPAEVVGTRYNVLFMLLVGSAITMALIVTAVEPVIESIFVAILGSKKSEKPQPAQKPEIIQETA